MASNQGFIRVKIDVFDKNKNLFKFRKTPKEKKRKEKNISKTIDRNR
jgi:hypothetical protein